MQAFFKKISEYFLNFISQYSLFANKDYYRHVLSQHDQFPEVFISGMIFLLLVYFSSTKEQKKVGFFKVLAIIVLINSCTVLSNSINTSFNQGVYYKGIGSIINVPDNLISGFILTLVIFSCYKKRSGQAFLFGIATYVALPLLNFPDLRDINGVVFSWEIYGFSAVVGLVCLIISRRKYFFTSWIWYFAFHMFMRIGGFLVSLLIDSYVGRSMYTAGYTVRRFIEYLSHFTVDIVIFTLILVFSIAFEKGVLTVNSKRKIA